MDQNSKPAGGSGAGLGPSSHGPSPSGGALTQTVSSMPTTMTDAPLPTMTTHFQLFGFILRSVAIVTTFIATVVMGVAKETQFILVNVTYKATELSQLEYFVAVNAIAFIYASASLGLSLLKRRSPARNLMLIVCIVDVLMVCLLFSGIGSASAIGVLGRNGDGRLWANKVCDSYKKFCGSIAGSVVMSMVGSLAYLALVFVYLVGGLHKK